MSRRTHSTPLTEEDQLAWVHVLRRCTSAPLLYFGARPCDERDALIMYAAQTPSRCDCCGERFATLETQTGGFSTWIQVRLHRPDVRRH